MKIVAIMEDIHYIAKGDKTVNGQYRFVSHDQVTERIQPLLVKHKVCVIPSTKSVQQDNNRTTVTLHVTFLNAECPTDQFTVEFPGYGIDAGDKGPGKAISYAFKYALLKTFNIATGDDPDKEANAVYEPEKCLEFDSALPADLSKKEMSKITRFLEDRAKAFNRHVEDVKRDAVKRMPEFLSAVKKWKEE